MSSKNASSKVVSVDEQAYEQDERTIEDKDEFEVVEETPELRATVQMEIQAKVDANHPDGLLDTSDERMRGVTLEQEECIRAREEELAYISAKAKLSRQDGRAERTQEVAAKGSTERRRTFEKRAASVNPLVDPDRPDPREELTRAELAAVNEQTRRIAERLPGWSRAAISRRLAERVVEGAELVSAVVGVSEELRRARGHVIPIADVSEVNRREVSIVGTVSQLWSPSHHRISQVGLLEDETGRVKFTTWTKSDQPMVREGEEVEFRSVAKNWYEGRCSVALTGWSSVHFPERGRWWE
ncbi:DNA-binding protein [Halorussus gelatinilyticus]|uniref:DNA-binding protein n=1 Tax=Halorussus gelatinilyticus TaxID=2937524 RepID=A0A8U0IE56_9EURY|nr:DNA-binding protein [Halorussus gelatinilyticus]UPV98980.1 DNA-binding protein [Halorussus gelatinilyticus]